MNDNIPAEDFAAYVDGMLSAQKKNELESHFSRCPACLDELLEIAAIMRSRDKIPAQFLKLALGEKSKLTKPVLHLRLAFEIAAAFVVVVFIGYLFLGGNWPWQSDVRPKMASPGSASERFPAPVVKAEHIAPMSQAETDLDAAEKTKNNLSASGAQSTVTVALKTQEMKKTRMDKGLSFSAAEAEQNRERQKKPGAGAALPIEAKEGKLKDEESLLRHSEVVPETTGAAQPVLVDKKQDAALARKEIADKIAVPLIRIEGDAVWTDLRNPELFFAWSWFNKDLALELQIDSAGTVIAVVPLGKIDPLLAKQAENEAKKLLFSVSKKKSRRVWLVADESAPNPAELRSPRQRG